MEMPIRVAIKQEILNQLGDEIEENKLDKILSKYGNEELERWYNIIMRFGIKDIMEVFN